MLGFSGWYHTVARQVKTGSWKIDVLVSFLREGNAGFHYECI